MTRKLSAMFSLLAVGILIGTWLIRRAMGLPTVGINEFFGVALAVFVSCLILGRVYARLGVSMIKEVIAERRSREEERRARARQRYEAALDEPEDTPPSAQQATAETGE